MEVWGIPLNGVGGDMGGVQIPFDVQKSAKELFKDVDLDGNGRLSRSEVRTMLAGLVLSTNVHEDEKMWFRNADWNKDEQIDLNEFINIYGHLMGNKK